MIEGTLYLQVATDPLNSAVMNLRYLIRENYEYHCTFEVVDGNNIIHDAHHVRCLPQTAYFEVHLRSNNDPC